jgi:hypothetical protein
MNTAGRGWELAENSILYWLLVAYRAAHLTNLASSPEQQLRSAMRDADHRLRRSTHPSDAKVVEFLRPIATRVMMDGNDQIRKRAERAEMKLAIYRLSEAFGALGDIRCAQCGDPAKHHCLEDDEDNPGELEMALYRVDRYYAGRCSNWPAR